MKPNTNIKSPLEDKWIDDKHGGTELSYKIILE
jgi:hypothetical protein